MTRDRDPFTIGRIMVLVAAIALLLAGLVELMGDGGLRVMIAVGPGSPWVLHLAFALLILLWLLAAHHVFSTACSVIGSYLRRQIGHHSAAGRRVGRDH